MEITINRPALNAGEQVYDEGHALAIREFCIEGLSNAVPKFMSQDRAADLVCEWFPSDRLALASLYKRISRNNPFTEAA